MDGTMRLLIIEDDPDFGLSLKKGLESETFAVDLTDSGEQGLTHARLEDYDIIVLDMALPGDLQGPEVARAIQQYKPTIPIIAISGQYLDEDSKVDMLDVCDDYIIKGPTFSIRELVARIRVVLRRPPLQFDAVLKIGDLTLDPQRHLVTRGGRTIDVHRAKEFALLEYFMRHVEQVISRTVLLSRVWDQNADPLSKTVDVTMQRLRQKIDGPFTHHLFHTVPGRGYKLDA